MNSPRVFFNSAALTAVLFSPSTNVLQVEFRNGLVYEYLGVSVGLYEQLLAAPSKGSFFARFIRGRCIHRRVDRHEVLTQ